MRIAITGGSGFVGRQLVPRLAAKGVTLLLIGRDPDALRERYPDCDAASYEEIASAAVGCDLLLHLAVLNNSQTASDATFARVNVDLVVNTCRKAIQAGIPKFIYVSSTHALDAQDKSAYARSKRAATRELELIQNIDLRMLYLPAVIGDELAGRLAILNRFPAALRGAVMLVLTALKPTVQIDQVATAVLTIAQDSGCDQKSVLVTNDQQANFVFTGFKRLLDVVSAIAVIILLWWAMLTIWVAIRLSSPGPAIFKQSRVGVNGDIFTCYKFRTMFVSTPEVGTHEVAANSVTSLGGFLRRTKLDELPQVLNILMNQMSLVGPRPCLPSQTKLIENRRALGVLLVKPGITGLAQINGIDMSKPSDLAKWDKQYLLLQSILLDLKIILQTARGKGSGDNVR